MSSDLVWLLTRANSSFLVKRNGIQLSREAGNILNKQSLKSSGISSLAPVTITPASPSGVTITLKKQSLSAHKVRAANVDITLTGNVRQSAKKVVNILSKYRPDLIKAALARLSRIIQSQAPPKPLRVRKTRGVSKK